MRTVTFSDPKVARALADVAVCAWVNRIDGFHNCEPSTEQWIFKSDADAYTTRNICSFFMTPDLQVLHYASGYYSPAIYRAEIDFAARLREALFDKTFKPVDDAEARFKELHQARAKELRAAAERATGKLGLEDGFAYDGEKHAHDSRCASVVSKAYGYIASVCEDFVSGGKGSGLDHAVTVTKPGRTEVKPTKPNPLNMVWIDATRTEAPKPTVTVVKAVEKRTHAWVPTLTDVETDYLYGNPFAEEHSKTKARPKSKKLALK